MDLHPDFRDLLAEFARSGVSFAVLGGYAVGHHATPRATKDLDLLVSGEATNLARVAEALQRSLRKGPSLALVVAGLAAIVGGRGIAGLARGRRHEDSARGHPDGLGAPLDKLADLPVKRRRVVTNPGVP